MDLAKPHVTGPRFWELYSGKREVLGEALFSHDPYDQFGWCQEWRFALADYLYWDLGEYVYGYRSEGPDVSNYAYSQLVINDASTEACEYALMILDRYREWLRIAEEDY